MPDYKISAKVEADATSMEKAFDSAKQSLEAFGKKMESVADRMNSLGKGISSFGKTLAPVSAAVAGAGVASGKMALDFEDSMANINTLLDDDKHLQGYENAVKRISNNTGLSLDSMADGMYQAISSLGDGGTETEQIFNTMARSAKAGGAEVTDSVSLISAGMKGYNSVSNETAQKLSDLAFQTAKLGVTTFPEMAKSMQPLFPLANSLNISYEELFGSMATLTGVTGNTAEVSTQLKAVFSNLMAPTTAMQGVIEKYGYSSGQAMLESEGLAGMLKIVQNETGGQADKMAALFSSTEAVTAMTALTGSQFDTFGEKLGAMSDVTGTTDAAYEKLITTGDKLRRAWNQIKNAGVSLGQTMIEMLLPTIEKVSEKIDMFSEYFANADDSTKRMIITIGAVVAAAAPLLMGLGTFIQKTSSVVSVIGKLAPAFSGLVGPVGIVIGVIAALAAGFAYLMSTNDGFRESVMQVVDNLKTAFMPVLQTFSDMISTTAAAVIPILQSALQSLIPAFEQIVLTVGQIITTILPVLITLVQQLTPFISQIVVMIAQIIATVAPMIAQLVGSLLPVIMDIITVVTNIVQSVMPAVISIINVIMAVIQTLVPIIEDILSVVISVVSGVISAIGPVVSFIGGVISSIMAIISPIVTFIANIIATIIQVVGTIVGAVTGVFSTVFSVVSSVFSGISQFISGTINTISSVISGITSTVANAFNSVYSIISSIMGNVRVFISGVFNGIKSAWTGLTTFVSGIFSGIGSAVQGLVNTVKGFVNGVISGINAAIGLINMIPMVNISPIPYLLHGTDDWGGGFARMNEGGRGELTYLPDGTQVIPHDLSVQYTKEAARANAGAATQAIDYEYLIEGMCRAMGNVKVQHVSTLNGRVVAEETLPLTDRGLGQTAQMRGRYAT